MKKKYMQVWVKALRSGKYNQCNAVLRTSYGFCPLGILCDITKKEVKGRWSRGTFYSGKWSRNRSFLPNTVRELTGIKSQEGNIKGFKKSLSKLNDSGKSFSEIADIIEKNWRKL